MTEIVHHIYPRGGELNVLYTSTTNKPIVTRPMKHKSANDSQQKQSVWTNKEMMSKRNSSFDFARYFLRRQDFFSPGSKTSKRREENPKEEEGTEKEKQHLLNIFCLMHGRERRTTLTDRRDSGGETSDKYFRRWQEHKG